jgi:DNA gyrase inhibitor GyrI
MSFKVAFWKTVKKDQMQQIKAQKMRNKGPGNEGVPGISQENRSNTISKEVTSVDVAKNVEKQIDVEEEHIDHHVEEGGENAVSSKPDNSISIKTEVGRLKTTKLLDSEVVTLKPRFRNDKFSPRSVDANVQTLPEKSNMVRTLANNYCLH